MFSATFSFFSSKQICYIRNFFFANCLPLKKCGCVAKNLVSFGLFVFDLYSLGCEDPKCTSGGSIFVFRNYFCTKFIGIMVEIMTMKSAKCLKTFSIFFPQKSFPVAVKFYGHNKTATIVR